MAKLNKLKSRLPAASRLVAAAAAVAVACMLRLPSAHRTWFPTRLPWLPTSMLSPPSSGRCFCMIASTMRLRCVSVWTPVLPLARSHASAPSRVSSARFALFFGLFFGLCTH